MATEIKKFNGWGRVNIQNIPNFSETHYTVPPGKVGKVIFNDPVFESEVYDYNFHLPSSSTPSGELNSVGLYLRTRGTISTNSVRANLVLEAGSSTVCATGVWSIRNSNGGSTTIANTLGSVYLMPDPLDNKKMIYIGLGSSASTNNEPLTDYPLSILNTYKYVDLARALEGKEWTGAPEELFARLHFFKKVPKEYILFEGESVQHRLSYAWNLSNSQSATAILKYNFTVIEEDVE